MIIESERLFLRNVTVGDVDDLYREIFSDLAVVKHTFGKEITSKVQAQNYILENTNTEGVFGLSAMIERDGGKLIGLGGVIECHYLDVVDYEFGFILGKSYWGKGYAKEIGRAQIDYIKDKTSATRALALVSSVNLGSVKTITNLGLEYLTSVETKGRGSRDVYIKYFS